MTPVDSIIDNAETSAINRGDAGYVPDGFADLIELMAAISAGPREPEDATHVCVGVDGAVTTHVIDAIGRMPVQHEPVVGCFTLPAGWGPLVDVHEPDAVLDVWREFVEGGAS